MTNTAREEREDAFRGDIARVVQAVRHYLPATKPQPESASLAEPLAHLASLLADDAPVELLQEAALTVVDAYEWPEPEAAASGEGPVINPAILAAVERLRCAMDYMD
jgi:hypothetical protein